MGDLDYMMLMPFLFFFLFFMAYLFRKRKVEKILFSEFDESEKDLEAREFFNRMLKIERSAKGFYYVEVIFLIINTFFILFGGYKTYLKEVEFVKEYPRFTESPLSSTLIKFMIPIIMWVLVFFLIIFAMIMKKKENKRITEMLDNLEKAKFLKFAKEDFLKSDRILETGMVVMSEIKLGDRYLFSVYPAYIVPYTLIKGIKVEKFSRPRGKSIYYLDISLKRFFQDTKIYFAKKDVAEKVREFILERNKDLYEKENTEWDI
ncbi:hypothetical protein ABVN58_01365 [Fusobacterium polymorphum]|nr:MULTISPECIES: hypothetical protein [Fusobacterium]ERT45594.1 hypothetical protein HMPREF1767_02313 [Fusobacterium nucleatum CTI-6]ETZ27041.1 hypothetical protein HMPREF2085_01101 [Fusobacterium nucleatum 13_3C]ETZ27109.1 hypothetical protein HMPREF2085_01091 [Fusobacterium nucleatum 13_3C]BEO95831.1 hypothetical protein FNCP10_06860 [Fusobacterium nucleatum]BEP08370.1 hypothetical protein FNSP10_17440 [Fusobacterium nucleatum]